MKEIILMLHPTFGVLGIISAFWVLVETLNASDKNRNRICIASIFVTVFMVLTWIAGGYWYVVHYAVDKAVILKGPWPFAHNFFMETKEHLFFMTLVLSLFLPMVVWMNNLASNRSARIVVFTVTAFIILSALALEGAGSVIAMGVKLGLVHGAGAL